MSRELPDELHQQIKRLCAEGDSLAEKGSFKQAVTCFEQALALVPAPAYGDLDFYRNW